MAKIIDDEQDYITYGDESLESAGGMEHWEPDEEPPPIDKNDAPSKRAPPGHRGRIKIPVRR